ncbi:hypothetical protein SISNIDRAFT_484619 [Sistotremastrum niveocremeum HHB9708]|uniref:Uncharacterized protein n=1 Tax=Sistotremastrum niveocremeum HHB9708 TaxID=1314777 RepID=A0A164VRE1_9AGAM|nr:hypothetical protein SISNIDRAFT_484619 [Sistotremastrum niveocremeum HHB9708]
MDTSWCSCGTYIGDEDGSSCLQCRSSNSNSTDTHSLFTTDLVVPNAELWVNTGDQGILHWATLIPYGAAPLYETPSSPPASPSLSSVSIRPPSIRTRHSWPLPLSQSLSHNTSHNTSHHGTHPHAHSPRAFHPSPSHPVPPSLTILPEFEDDDFTGTDFSRAVSCIQSSTEPCTPEAPPTRVTSSSKISMNMGMGMNSKEITKSAVTPLEYPSHKDLDDDVSTLNSNLLDREDGAIPALHAHIQQQAQKSTLFSTRPLPRKPLLTVVSKPPSQSHTHASSSKNERERTPTKAGRPRAHTASAVPTLDAYGVGGGAREKTSSTIGRAGAGYRKPISGFPTPSSFGYTRAELLQSLNDGFPKRVSAGAAAIADPREDPSTHIPLPPRPYPSHMNANANERSRGRPIVRVPLGNSNSNDHRLGPRDLGRERDREVSRSGRREYFRSSTDHGHANGR